MQAIILAAGLGSRIREFHDLPKGFISVGESPIILESINKLKIAGITNILIVTGYRSECYEAIAAEDTAVTTVFNPFFQEKGNLFSLYCAKKWVTGHTLILESDILYEQRALEAVLSCQSNNVVLVSGQTHSSDEVYVQADQKSHQLQRMSKDRSRLTEDSILGEFVGVNKLSFDAYFQLIQLVEKDETLLCEGYYEEDGLVALSQFQPVNCHKVSDLLWCEIDDVAQLERARKLYPKLSNEPLKIFV